MQTRGRSIFATIRSEGALLPTDLLQRVINGDRNLPGVTPDAYHLNAGEKLNEATNRAWNRLVGAWAAFTDATAKLPASDPGTTVTRERWLLPLFSELGYGRLLTTKALEVEGKPYPISHGWQHTPMHLVGCRVDLDRRAAGVAGASRSSPHGLVQELLNRSDAHLWGIVSNGLRLRILRDNSRLTRQAYVEFDLEAMMTGEVYADFVLLWLVCHESRVEAERPESCWLEQWSKAAQEQGTRALDQLRNGVEEAITALGRGFLTHSTNQGLRDSLQSGTLEAQEYYRQLLRLVYRLLFLFVAEDRDLLCAPHADPAARERYTRFYSTARLRRLAERRVGTRHADLFHGLRLVMQKLSGDAGCPELALPALGSLLFSDQAIPALDLCEIANHDLLDAIRALAFSIDGNSRRIVDYKNLGSEELGSVYESLLELHPVLHLDAGTFELKTAGGHERKTTGSYYTPTSLIQCLLDSALDPVLEEAAQQDNPEAALLKLKICDPACGSGHFLIAAAHRIAKRLAAVRTGDEEPSPEAVRTALRDVIGHCIYGVDLNPMAVELCKVSLWMEALEPGKPLSFLDHRIQCGNSLLGATPALLVQGIPDEAFDPIEGDDKEVCKKFRKQNREERGEGKVKPGEGRVRGQMPLFDAANQPWQRLGDLASGLLSVAEIPDDTIEGIRRKQERYEELIRSSGYLYGRLWADAWCAAFVWKKTKEFPYPITEEAFRRIERNPFSVAPWMRDEVQRLARQYQFFHWHLAFPDVFRLSTDSQAPENEQAGWSGGFDLVLGNPPWERVKLQEKEFFAERSPEIADAPNAAARKRLIAKLASNNPSLMTEFQAALRRADGESHLLRRSGRYPLCGRGDINVYTVFAEGMRNLLNDRGRVGCVLPSGIATDDTTKLFFQDIVGKQALVSFFDFENRDHLFASLHTKTKFCLFTISSVPSPTAKVCSMATVVEDLRDPRQIFEITPSDLSLINPNTGTCPLFRTGADAELTKKIYRCVPVLMNERTGENPWGVGFMRMFDMANDSGLFQSQPDEGLVPLYEAKMMWHFDHRWATYNGENSRECSDKEKQSPDFFVRPRYWLPKADVDSRLRGRWSRSWLLAFRDVTDTRNERSVVFSLLPLVAVGHKAPLVFLTSTADITLASCFLANATSLVLDFVARQKIGGLSLSYFILNQLPFLSPHAYRTDDIRFITPRVLELVYTSWDMKAFADDLWRDADEELRVLFRQQFRSNSSNMACCKSSGEISKPESEIPLPPFKWEERRRAQLRAELDAYYALMHGLTREELRYILDPADVYGLDFPSETFRVLKAREFKEFGEYRTCRLVLEAWDALVDKGLGIATSISKTSTKS